MNLLKETLEDMTKYGKCEQDVMYVLWGPALSHKTEKGDAVGCKVSQCLWEDFKKVASKIDYDNGFGSQEINSSLIVAFKDDSWLERKKYDGAEGWVYKCPPELGNIVTVNLKEIKKNIWDAPCEHCDHVEYGFDRGECSLCHGFDKWEEK